MLKLKNITIKNFMSVGAVTQAVRFDKDGMTLVLGNNLDLGGDGARNGTGKTTIVNALCYALFGQAITSIRRDNLINKTNGKQMVVTLEFEKDNHNYTLVRGRRPNQFKFFVDDAVLGDEATDEAQGENRHTQAVLEELLGFGVTMFKHIVALNTYTEPFLNMRAHDQREFIEELLGITQLSKKAEVLKENAKSTKENITKEEFRIRATKEANTKIYDAIDDTKRRSKVWNTTHENKIGQLTQELVELNKLDVDAEIYSHQNATTYYTLKDKLERYTHELEKANTDIQRAETTLTSSKNFLTSAKDQTCHACGQELHDNIHEKQIQKYQQEVINSTTHYDKTVHNATQIKEKIEKVGDIGDAPQTQYKNLHDAYEHQSQLNAVATKLEELIKETDPYTDQIESLTNTGLQEINYNTLNEFNDLLNHQEFLLKLLLNKDSFIRKKIIDQNLSYLNSRLGEYIAKVGLSHVVKFLNDLSVEITELGRDLDFDNLSRGERNRLILSLSWAFRDVFESLNHPINLMFIDEVIDSGMDSMGVEASLAVLKTTSRDRHKNIFLISHREELLSRVNTVLNVIKENGFTSFNKDND